MDVISINMDASTLIWIERDQKAQVKKNERITHRSLLRAVNFLCIFIYLDDTRLWWNTHFNPL